MARRSSRCHATETTVVGLRAVVLENEHLRALIVLDRGADVLELWHKPSNVQVFWRSPLGVRPYGLFMPAEHADRATFFDYYAGGLQEIFPNGGPSCRYKGAELGFHGEACKIPWQGEITNAEDEASVRCETRTARLPFYLTKRFSLRATSQLLHIDAALTNESGQEMDCMWGFHPAYGEPLLGSNTRLHIPARDVEVHPEAFATRQRLRPGATFPWPGPTADAAHPRIDRLLPGAGPSADLCYLKGLEEGWYLLVNEDTGLAAAMRWDPAVFPYVWFWQECHDVAGYPWYGRYHIVAVEPWSSYPGSGLGEAMRRGTQLRVPPHTTIATQLAIGAVHIDPDAGVPCGVDDRGRVQYTRPAMHNDRR